MTYDEYLIIANSCHKMTAHCRKALVKLIQIPHQNRTELVHNQITYWRNCISAYKWQAGLAWQQVTDKNDRQPATV